MSDGMVVSVRVYATIRTNIGRQANRSLDESQDSTKPNLGRQPPPASPRECAFNGGDARNARGNTRALPAALCVSASVLRRRPAPTNRFSFWRTPCRAMGNCASLSLPVKAIGYSRAASKNSTAASGIELLCAAKPKSPPLPRYAYASGFSNSVEPAVGRTARSPSVLLDPREFASTAPGRLATQPQPAAASAAPPPKLECSGALPPFSTFTAQYLNSGILPKGSSTGLVSLFAAAS